MLEGSCSLKIVYIGLFVGFEKANNAFRIMVGAGRFERPTPCAQGSFRDRLETVYFQYLLFQVDTANSLNLGEAFGF